MNSTKLFRNFLQCGSGILLFLVILAGSLCGQTEIVGEVSGVWDIEGSPYLVWDSTWVRQNRTLRIEPGVEVLFEENWGLWVNGSLIARGTEDDSVRFQSANEDSDWRGIFMLQAYERLEFDYCVYKGATDGITIDDTMEININHSIIISEDKAIGGSTPGGLGASYNCVMDINNSVVMGNPCIDNVANLRLDSNNSTFYKNLYADECRLTATSCNFYDDLIVGYCDYFNCRFIDSGDSLNRMKVVNLAGDMNNCISEITINVQYVNCEIVNLVTTKTIRGFAGVTMDSSLIGYLSIHAEGNNDDIIIQNSTISKDMRLTSLVTQNRVSLNKCFIHGDAWIYFDNIGIDSCEFRERDDLENQSILRIISGNQSTVSVSRSIIALPIHLSVDGIISFDHNTVFMSDSIRRSFMLYSYGDYNDMYITNNVFLAENADITLFRNHRALEIPPVFRYNLVFGFRNLFFYDYAEFEFDSTNLEEDPLFFNVDSLDFHLTENSPCIDAGDPDSPLDPDGTRADIGAYYFDQSNSIGYKPTPLLENAVIIDFPYPNPFNDQFSIGYRIANPTSNLMLSIYDLNGRKLFDKTIKVQRIGTARCDPQGVLASSGTYFLNVSVNNDSRSYIIHYLK